MRYILMNTNILNNKEGEFLQNMDIIISDGKIQEIGKNLSPNDCTVLKYENKFVIPGMFESHAHIGHVTQSIKEVIVLISFL